MKCAWTCQWPCGSRREGRLVPSHGEGHGLVEEAVVALHEALQHDGERIALGGIEVGQAWRGTPRHQEELERPDGPEGHQGEPVRILVDDADPAGLLGRRRRAGGRDRPARRWPRCVTSSRPARSGSAEPAQICPCGCGFEAPIASPRFSKIWTQRLVAPRSVVCVAHRSMTSRTPSGGMCVRVRSCRGEKQTTRQVPGCDSAIEQPVLDAFVPDVGAQGGEVVGEDEGRRVVGVPRSAGADVAGAEVARRVVGRPRRDGRASLRATQPGPLRPALPRRAPTGR